MSFHRYERDPELAQHSRDVRRNVFRTQHAVCIELESDTSTRLLKKPPGRRPALGLHSQRSTCGLLQSIPDQSTRLIFIVDGASAVSSCVMNSTVPGYMVVPLTTQHCCTSRYSLDPHLGWNQRGELLRHALHGSLEHRRAA